MQNLTNKPLCSIVMPSFKSKEYIGRSIKSIQNQTYTNWELFIIDDASQDETVEYIKNNFCNEDSRVNVVELKKNSGAAVARNTGIEKAKGQFIAFLDCDDIWLPTKLEKQIHFMEKNDFSISYTAFSRVDIDDNHLSTVHIPNKVSYKQLLKTNVIGCSTAMYNAEKLGKIYMPLIRKRQDFGLWLRILKKVDFAYGLEEVLTHYTVRDGSISSNKRSAAQFTWKLYREVEKLPLVVSLYCFMHYAVKGVLRTRLPKVASWLKI